MAESMLGSAIQFLDVLGLYDIILPFLLVFTIVYAMLEKSLILGTEGEGLPRKNLNAIVAFVIGFLVVASTSLVANINEVVANTVLLLILIFCYLLLVGSFTTPQEGKSIMDEPMRIVFVAISFIGILLIFFNALESSSSEMCGGDAPCTWLEIGFGWLALYWDSSFVGSIILLALLAGIVWFIQRGDK